MKNYLLIGSFGVVMVTSNVCAFSPMTNSPQCTVFNNINPIEDQEKISFSSRYPQIKLPTTDRYAEVGTASLPSGYPGNMNA